LPKVDARKDLSQQAANPLADLLSFPFQNNLNLNQGEFNRITNVLNIQPVFPFAEGRIITRTIFPIVRIPDCSSDKEKLTSRLSDIGFTTFYAPAGLIPQPKGSRGGAFQVRTGRISFRACPF
jgi:hypothetical protein